MARLHGGNCCQVCFKRRATTYCCARSLNGNGYCALKLCDDCARPAPSQRGKHVCPDCAKPVLKSGDPK